MKVVNLPNPLDVVPILTQNNSLMLVILFENSERAEKLYQYFIYNHEISLAVIENKDKEFTFIIHSNNSAHSASISTKRTVENNPPLKCITDNNFKDYVYLTFGYKEKGQVLYNQSHSYPIFLNYKN